MDLRRIAPASVLALALAGAAWQVAAADASVRIKSPADGASLDRMERIELAYEAIPGPTGDHVHIYADGKEVGIVRRLEGRFTFDSFVPGPHVLCVKLVSKAHMPVGVERCIKVLVQ